MMNCKIGSRCFNIPSCFHQVYSSCDAPTSKRNQIYQQVHTIGALLDEKLSLPVTEACNLAEVKAKLHFCVLSRQITKMTEHTKSVEILVMDPSEKNIAANILKRHSPTSEITACAGTKDVGRHVFTHVSPLGHRVA